MSAFDEVMAEEWSYGNNSVLLRLDGLRSASVATFTGPDRELRAAIAVLGKRALALVLRHEWSGADTEGDIRCQECGAIRWVWDDTVKRNTERGHDTGCEWGALCDEVKRLRGGT